MFGVKLNKYEYFSPSSQVASSWWKIKKNQIILWGKGLTETQTPTRRLLGYERVYLTLSKVADTPFHIQGDEFGVLKWLEMV